MSAAEQVGSLPEIVELVIEFLEFDRAALYSAHLVNTTWAHYARVVLWRHAPLSSLAAVEPSRQQHYANMIRVTFSWNFWYPVELDKLSFPLLERCLLDMASLYDLAPSYHLFLPPFFSSSLHYLDMWLKGVDAPEAVTAYLRGDQFERKLRHREAPRRYYDDDRTPFSINAPKLRSLLWLTYVDRDKGEGTLQALQHLVSHGTYEELSFSQFLYNQEALESLLSTNLQRPLFPRLKHLSASIPPEALRALLDDVLPLTLSSLYLDIYFLGGGIFQELSRLPSLQSLTIVGRIRLDSMSNITPLGRLQNIRSLAIELHPILYPAQVGWAQTEPAPFTEADFEMMTSGLSPGTI